MQKTETMTDKELNIIANFNEECQEVIKECIGALAECSKATMKAVRFGFDSDSNLRRVALDRKPIAELETARTKLSTEVGQLKYLLHLMIENDMFNLDYVNKGYNQKQSDLSKLGFKYIKIVETNNE